ncbi:hypothetical protein ACLB1T_05170 [Escherichia coli]
MSRYAQRLLPAGCGNRSGDDADRTTIWQAIIAEGLGAQYGDAVPLSLLRDELAQCLDQERISQRFLACNR